MISQLQVPKRFHREQKVIGLQFSLTNLLILIFRNGIGLIGTKKRKINTNAFEQEMLPFLM